MPNPFSKSTSIDKPYATFKGYGDFEWRILKTYKVPTSEAKDPYARWFVAARSPATFGEWELGDTYKAEVLKYGRLESCTEEWNRAYHGDH
jgi:hypothetical protein